MVVLTRKHEGSLFCITKIMTNRFNGITAFLHHRILPISPFTFWNNAQFKSGANALLDCTSWHILLAFVSENTWPIEKIKIHNQFITSNKENNWYVLTEEQITPVKVYQIKKYDFFWCLHIFVLYYFMWFVVILIIDLPLGFDLMGGGAICTSLAPQRICSTYGNSRALLFTA